ncbi:P27 family phage terminase small subunit [Bradyrhizobium sp. 174]|nr:P27 family phage terminase small subunit [Bradyrhizobium sp. 174]
MRAPTCLSHLCPAAKAEWKRLASQLVVLRILTDLDRGALSAYCQA